MHVMTFNSLARSVRLDDMPRSAKCRLRTCSELYERDEQGYARDLENLIQATVIGSDRDALLPGRPFSATSRVPQGGVRDTDQLDSFERELRAIELRLALKPLIAVSATRRRRLGVRIFRGPDLHRLIDRLPWI